MRARIGRARGPCDPRSLLATLLLSACATGPTQTEQTFGDSVRHMIDAQTYDRSTLRTPSEEAIDRTDGRMLEGALEAYRSTVAEPDSVGQEITIGVDR